MTSSAPLTIALIGFGPRGLAALESLAALHAGQNKPIHVDIYDPMAWTGSGPNYTPDQSDLCILNIPARDVYYEPPAFMASRIGAFLGWAKDRYQPDDFPSRADIGAYLHERYNALREAMVDTITISQSDLMITDLEQDGKQWWAISNGQKYGPYDEVLLSQGQPKTAPDPQLRRWCAHAQAHNLALLPAYPANPLIKAAEGWSGKTVAIRGMGLSTLDVLRLLTKGLGGRFVDGVYNPSGREPRKLLPFSLNGKPPVAKPATGAFDAMFDLTQAETDAFTAAMKVAEGCEADAALRAICDALVTRILADLGGRDTQEDVRIWLEMERTDPRSQDGLRPVEGLRADIEMALGRKPPDAGYVAGQVWRKLQDALRAAFNLGQYGDAVATALIGFDEAFKRYSYGPPVSASQELLALVENGIVSMCLADDPAVNLSASGWHLLDGEDAVTASCMVDAVLPNPNIETVEDPLIVARRSAGDMHPRLEGMGAAIAPEGQLVNVSGDAVRGLCMLGRLTLGSVIAVDGLNDCFGPSSARWANGVIKRHDL